METVIQTEQLPRPLVFLSYGKMFFFFLTVDIFVRFLVPSLCLNSLLTHLGPNKSFCTVLEKRQ